MNQIELVSHIMKFKGFPKMVPHRTINAIIKAADDIIAETTRKDVIATDGAGLHAWLASDDTGLSSRWLASVLTNSFCAEEHHPRDAGDFGRCVRMLKVVGINFDAEKVKEKGGPMWKSLAAQWPDLEREYEANEPKAIYERINRVAELVRQEMA